MKLGICSRLLATSALAAAGVLTSSPVTAQVVPENPGQAPAEESAVADGDIVVTGTRVVRDGYEAPNPTSVIGADDIAAKAPTNIADFVNQLPSLAGSSTPRNRTPGLSDGLAGVNALNLRNLGVPRTLVLLDGQRFGASTLNGFVDINQFPQALIERVDVVTGGASADWGSDAVAGVVNFVLDRDFTGVKGDVQGGISTYGDDANYKATLSVGTSFADDRGHFLLSGEIFHSDGIEGIGSRDWYNYNKMFTNPNYVAGNGQPQLLVRAGSGFATATPGGIITNGPLRGIYFGEGGVPLQFNYGSPIGGNIMQGGQFQYTDWAHTGDLDQRLGRQNVFGYASFDISDNVEFFAQFSWGRATSHAAFGTLPRYSSLGAPLSINNAFLPTSVFNQGVAAGVTTFTLGSFLTELGARTSNTNRQSYRPVIGLRGNFDALGDNWSWDIYGAKTIVKSYVETNVFNNARLLEAVDAVRSSNGTIVCRSTLTSPNNGCVPFNPFGTGVNTSAAIDYVNGTPWLRTRLTENVVAANLRGDPFSTWAGPVSLAVGVEHRKEEVSGTADALDLASQATSVATGTARVVPYQAGNFLPSFGSYNVTEGYLQAVVPLAKDEAFAQDLDLLLGLRATHYSTSGTVSTWKVGMTYKPVDDITLRITRSRDIRAPNLGELFQTDQATTVTIRDTANAGVNVTALQITSGNRNLQPERADTFGVGLVLQPSFIPGLSTSVDYWNIDIKDAITTLTAQVLLDQCVAGNSALCGNIRRNGAGVITSVGVSPINLSEQVARGIDFEASYRRPLGNGDFQFRVLATRNIRNATDNGINAVINRVGTNNGATADATALPRWTYSATLGWDSDPLSIQLTARGFSAGKYNTSYIECTTGCPVSTPDHQTVENNRLPGATYFDAYVSYKVTDRIETFVSVDNLLNKDPASVPWLAGGAPLSGGQGLYDAIGRMFRAGVRFRM